MMITLCTEFSPRYSMLQTSAANQTKQPIVSFHARLASAGASGSGIRATESRRAIAPVGGLSDNGARTRHGHGNSHQSFSVAQRIHCVAAGGAADFAG